MVVIVLNRCEIIMVFVIVVQQIQLVDSPLSCPLNFYLGHLGTNPQAYLKKRTYKSTGAKQTWHERYPSRDGGPYDFLPHQLNNTDSTCGL